MTHTQGVLLRLSLLAAACSLLPLAGCNDPLRVTDPDILTPGQLGDPQTLPTVRAGAIGDFSLAYTGDGSDGSGACGGPGCVEGVIMYGGLLADEWINSETFPTRIEVDARRTQITNADLDLWFRTLSKGRRAVENAAGRFATLAPTDPGYPEMLSLAGYSYLFFAENYCNGVPISQATPGGDLVYGEPLSNAELMDTAIARFDSALTAATAISDPDMVSLASVGKGRALIDLGNFAAAATAVSAVPTSFAYLFEHAENTDRENNGAFKANVPDQRYSAADAEGVNGFPFLSVPDPRTPIALDPAEVGFDGSTPLYDNLRYGDRKSSITLGTGVEARLIEAEAALQAGDTLGGGGFYTALNQPRANAADRPYFDNTTRLGTPAIGVLPNLTTADATTAGGAVNLLFSERARWLWLTAHRLGDMRRLIRQYLRNSETVFPTGPYFKVQFSDYGVDVNFPIPIDEQNNPNFTQCTDRNP